MTPSNENFFYEITTRVLGVIRRDVMGAVPASQNGYILIKIPENGLTANGQNLIYYRRLTIEF